MSIKCTHDPNLGSTVDTLESRQDLDREMNRLESWAITTHMKFDKSRCQILHLGQDNPDYRYSLGNEELESSSMGRDLGVWVNGKLNRVNSMP
ncbi:hypothetical protein WISP_62443 [Willisornis vidua]|uniref:Rna-directed dna polymerase from mobile element jockey-like n=1 Tax=Willisornis vidua TaxID=1566151 RepID=A0ABQ9DG66_9PASS|nr:hypothetical protein WISP_62443 [Willisornis vidua]